MANILTKNGQNGYFFKKLLLKLENFLTVVIYIYIHKVSTCSESSIFFAEKIWFCQKTSFDPKITISAISLNCVL